MKSKRSKLKIREIAEKEGLTIKQVEDIVNAPFRFTAKVIAEGDRKAFVFRNIRIFKFGLFQVKKERRSVYKNNLKKRDEKLNRAKKQSSDDLSGSLNDTGIQDVMGQG